MTRKVWPLGPWAIVGLALVCSAGCGGDERKARAPEAAPPSGAPEAKSNVCPDAARTQAAEERYTKGRALVEGCGEKCMKSASGGADRLKGLELLRGASADGHLKAQSLYGRTTFGDLATTGDGPELETEYVQSLIYLRLSARRGDADAVDYLPGLASVRVSQRKTFEPALERPLADLTAEWVASAFRQADEQLACYSP